jgi:hypothetical protein
MSDNSQTDKKAIDPEDTNLAMYPPTEKEKRKNITISSTRETPRDEDTITFTATEPHVPTPADEIRKRYEALLVDPKKFIRQIEKAADPEKVVEGLDEIAEIIPVILEKGQYALVQLVFEMFDRLCAKEAEEEIGRTQRFAVCVADGLLDSGVVNSLEEMLSSDIQEVRETGASIARSLGSAAVPALVSALETTENIAIRRSLLTLCLEFGDSAVPVLTAMLKQRKAQWFLYRNLIMLLGELGDPGAADVILPWLKHDDYRVRKEVVETITKLLGPASEKHILQALSDLSPDVVLTAMKCLGTIGSRNPSAIGYYLDMLTLQDKDTRPEADTIAAQAALNLGSVGNIKIDQTRTVEGFLIDLVSRGSNRRLFGLRKPVTNVSDGVRAAIYSALGQIGAKPSLKVLMRFNDSAKNLQQARVEAIRHIEARLSRPDEPN